MEVLAWKIPTLIVRRKRKQLCVIVERLPLEAARGITWRKLVRSDAVTNFIL